MKILALHQEKNSFIYAILERRRKKILLHEVGSCSLAYLHELDHTHGPFSYATCLRSSHAFIKKATLPKTKRSALSKAIPLYAETLSSIDPKEGFFLPIITSQGDAMQTQFIFTKQDHLQEHISYWQQKGFDPDYVTIVPQTLIRFCKSLFPELKESYILHVGQEEATLILMENHLLHTSICLNFNAADLQETNEESKHPINEIFSTIHSLEIDKSLPLLITGYQDQKFSHALEEALSGVISHIIPHKGKLGQWAKYATSIGSGLDALSKDNHNVQLRIKDFAPRKRLREIGRAVSLCYLFSFLLIFYISSEFSRSISTQKEHLQKQISQSISQDVSAMNREIPLVKDPDSLLHTWETLLHEESKPLPFILKAPSVTAFLDWISHHSLLQPKDVKVEKINYDLVQYPKIENTRRPYVAKVTLYMHIPSPLHARKLHDTLRADHSFIDQKKKELSWKEEKNHYTISFYLRNHNGLF